MNKSLSSQVFVPITASELYKRLRFNLGLPASTISARQVQLNLKEVMSESIRASLWALARSPDAEHPEPVYVTRFLNAARRLIPMADPTDREEDDKIAQGLRDTLIELELIGDLAPLQGGYWLPAPMRFVQLLNIDRWLMVGGVPTYLMSVSVRDKLEFSGAARLLSQEPASINLPSFTQSKEDWCRQPIEPIDVWTSKIIENKKLKPYDNLEQQFEFYAPGLLNKRSSGHVYQYNRWENQIHRLPDNRYLSRYKASFGLVFHLIVEVKLGKVVASSPIDLPDAGVRRLMYGLDLAAGHPVTVKTNLVRTDGLVYTLKNELPGPENRIFYTLGFLQENATGKYYPRSWEIKKSFRGEADAALIGLGIKLL